MIQHIVIVKWKPGTTEQQVLDACRNAGHLPNEIDGVQRITIGRNRAESEHGFTHALIVELADEAALARQYAEPSSASLRRFRSSRDRQHRPPLSAVAPGEPRALAGGGGGSVWDVRAAWRRGEVGAARSPPG